MAVRQRLGAEWRCKLLEGAPQRAARDGDRKGAVASKGDVIMISRRNFSAMMLAGAAAAMMPAAARAQTAVKARNAVLVHGAWADGSSWGEVIPRLQAAGLNVTAVQNPLTSLADSIAATRRGLALQDGPTVLAAHSWGGTVISETGI